MKPFYALEILLCAHSRENVLFTHTADWKLSSTHIADLYLLLTHNGEVLASTDRADLHVLLIHKVEKPFHPHKQPNCTLFVYTHTHTHTHTHTEPRNPISRTPRGRSQSRSSPRRGATTPRSAGSAGHWGTGTWETPGSQAWAACWPWVLHSFGTCNRQHEGMTARRSNIRRYNVCPVMRFRVKSDLHIIIQLRNSDLKYGRCLMTA